VAVAEGRRAGRRRRACGVLREPGGYWPTGLVAAVAAEEILTGELRARGSLPVSDAVDPDRFMATMAARGIRFQVTVDGATATRGERW
jgi:hypothetical protein